MSDQHGSEWSPDSRREILLPDSIIEALGQRWPALRRKIARACQTLNQVLEEVEEVEPAANYYLDGTGNLNLMCGPTHDGHGASSQQQRIIYSADLRAGGGDW